MDRTTRAFVYCSLAYLVAGVLLGGAMGVDPVGWMGYRFAHVHLLLLGFMGMMVYGVGYFILPRFNAVALAWPRLVPLHLWTANVGLVGLCLSRDGLFLPEPWVAPFATLEIFSVFLFVTNLGVTLRRGAVHTRMAVHPPAGGGAMGPAAPAAAPPSSTPRPVSLRDRFTFTLDTPVAELLDRLPGAAEILARHGVTGLDDPANLAHLGRLKVTVGRLAENQGIDGRALLGELNRPPAAPTGAPPRSRATPLKISLAPLSPPAAGGPVTGESIIGEVIGHHPEAKAVFERRFGSGCFTCPGQATESVGQAAMMHGIAAESLAAEINAVIQGRADG
ncbi:MAG: hypothetical protein CO080_03005 [Nitrospirae bacterium CG_4_9_14_0_8_um_filter_70_14]|nr:MAG: hypothetical protein CO080_03005 [Nitrospirae bacterium CG_4_9_14_0_8_um_filter_70_14]